jgi:WD40 repeat protein
MTLTFDAQPTAGLFDRGGAVFTLGDGVVRFGGGEAAQAHEGAVLCAAVHPSGDGVVTGGDDGRVCWVTREETTLLARASGWVDSVAAAPATGLIAFSSGRTVSVIDAADPAFRRDFAHERTVSGVAFDPKGRRVAASTYGGAALWYARIEKQQPTRLSWAGSHTGVWVSPDGAFVITAMQDNQLHGWRLKDGKNLRMGGYAGKVKSVAWLSGGRLMATSGAFGAVLWPFAGANGPMGREASEVGFDQNSQVVHVAAAPEGSRVAAGLSDGRVWVADPAARGLDFIRAERGAPVAALAMSADGRRLLWGDEDGAAAVVDLP